MTTSRPDHLDFVHVFAGVLAHVFARVFVHARARPLTLPSVVMFLATVATVATVAVTPSCKVFGLAPLPCELTMAVSRPSDAWTAFAPP